MYDFTFCNPTKLILGKDTIGQIGQEIKNAGIKKVLLLAGGGSIKKNNVYDAAVTSLKQSEVEWCELWGIQPNPILSKVNEAIEFCKKEKVEAVLAVGGGSVLDSAKAIAAGVAYKEDIWPLFETHVPITKAIPVFSILTISATGSEMNGNAVITNVKKKRKFHIFGPAIYPKVSILDPTAQYTLPWHQTVNGAIDAMSHIHEFYFVGASETTVAVNEALLKTIVKCTDTLKKDPENYDARADLAWSATLALNGISGAGMGFGEWVCHGIEHGISALYPKIAHGAGLSIMFPAWMQYFKDQDSDMFTRWANNVWGKATKEEGIQALKDKYSSWGAPITLKEAGVTKTDIEFIGEHSVCYDCVGFHKKVTKEDIVKILELAEPAIEE